MMKSIHAADTPMKQVGFAATVPGASLLEQIKSATSRFKRDGLKDVYEKARRHYESQTDREPGQHADVSIPGHEEIAMNIEQLIAANTAALEANTAALLKSGGTAGTAATTTTKAKAKEKDAEATSKNSREELAALMGKVKDAKTGPVAKALIKDVGGADKLAEVKVDKVDALFDAATKLLEADDDM